MLAQSQWAFAKTIGTPMCTVHSMTTGLNGKCIIRKLMHNKVYGSLSQGFGLVELLAGKGNYITVG